MYGFIPEELNELLSKTPAQEKLEKLIKELDVKRAQELDARVSDKIFHQITGVKLALKSIKQGE